MIPLGDNPILWRELTSRWRSRDGKSTGKATLIVVSGAVAAIYILALRNLKIDGSVNGARDEFSLTVLLLSLAIWLLTPAMVANAISHEREQACWNLLQTSLLTPRQVVVGKFVGRTAPMVGIVVLTLPVLLACGVAGLLGIGFLLFSIGVMLVWIVTLASVSLLVSAYTSRSAISIGVAYMFPALLVLGTGVAMALFPLMGIGQVDSVSYLNPFVMVGVITKFTATESFQPASASAFSSIAVFLLVACSALALATARLSHEWRT